MTDELPPQLPGETHQQYARRVTATLGHPIYATSEMKPLSPRTPIKVTLWTAGGIAAAIFLAGWNAANRLSHIEETMRGFDQRIGTLTSSISGTDPAHLRDMCRDVLRRELAGGLTVECPRATRRGESVSSCRVVPPISLRGERE
jgi:hypothetical protein